MLGLITRNIDVFNTHYEDAIASVRRRTTNIFLMFGSLAVLTMIITEFEVLQSEQLKDISFGPISLFTVMILIQIIAMTSGLVSWYANGCAGTYVRELYRSKNANTYISEFSRASDDVQVSVATAVENHGFLSSLELWDARDRVSEQDKEASIANRKKALFP